MTVREAKKIIRKAGYRLLEDLSTRDIEEIQKRFPKYYNRHISFLEADVKSGQISTTDALLILQSWYAKDEIYALGIIDNWSEKYNLPRA